MGGCVNMIDARSDGTLVANKKIAGIFRRGSSRIQYILVKSSFGLWYKVIC